MQAKHFISTAVRTGLVIAIAALLLAPNLHAQSSPLTVQPSTGRVGVGTTNPAAALDVNGTIVQSSSWPFIRTNTNNMHLAFNGGDGSNYYSGAWMYLRGASAGFNPGGVEFYAGSGAAILDNAGNLYVTGTLNAAAKNFVIDHPLAPKTKQLVHSSLEGPEAAVYYRGEAQLVQGEATINLPDYFETLTRQEQRTVQLNAIDGWAPLFVSGGVKQGTFRVRTNAAGDQAQRFYWEVKAVRADIAPLVAEKPRDALRARLADRPVNAEPFVGLPK